LSNTFWKNFVTISGLFETGFWFVVPARKKQVLISNYACEAGTPHTASDSSIEDAADVRSTDGLRPVCGGP
jgi:hypothetical protein